MAEQQDALLVELIGRLERVVPAWKPGAVVGPVRPLTGGTSSLTYLAELGGTAAGGSPVVVKLAPPGLPPVRNRDILRQARLQASVNSARTGLVPDVLFTDPGEPPAVPPLMAMTLVEGECVEPVLAEEADRVAPADVRERYLGAARVLADLHRLSPSEIGLGDEPIVTLADEVDRWTRPFETLPPHMQGDFRTIEKALRATMPEPLPPVVSHGDFRLGNTLCSRGEVTAVIDWEIWALGDPRVDVTWLTFFTDDADHPAVEPGMVAGTPTGDEILAAYVEARGHEVPDLDWFRALTRYKEAGLTGLLLKRADKTGGPVKPALERMRPTLTSLLDEALELLSDMPADDSGDA